MASRDVAVRVDGLRDLRRRLRQVDKGSGREVNRASKQAGQKVADRAKVLAPRRTGRLADSIRVGSRGDRITVRSRLPYAAPIHWGWPARNIAANPFLTRAVDETRARYLADLEVALRETVRRYGLGP